MRSKLILSLWLIGGRALCRLTAFLANALLGGGTSTPADKEKAARWLRRGDAQCEQDSLASRTAETDETKHRGGRAETPRLER